MATDSTKPSITKACVTCGQEFDNEPDQCPLDGTPLAVIASELAPGTILSGRYEILGTVADGGMGKVYKARHKLMNRTVAIKTIHSHLISSTLALKRFQQEAQAVSSLNHPNILTVFDFFVSDDGQPYLVMDYLEGTNLQEVIGSEHKLQLERALPMFIAACSALTHAHEHGVIHRDIKPANIMLVHFDGVSDFVKIVDFGIAKLTAEESKSCNLTATGDVFGSPEYMSPEQCRAKTPDARSDIYSLGCVMYSTLSGTLPFPAQDSMQSMYKHVYETPPPLHTVCPDTKFPKELETIIYKAMEKEPEHRFQSIAEMQQALMSIQAANAGSQPEVVTAGHNSDLLQPQRNNQRLAVKFLATNKGKLMLGVILALPAISTFFIIQQWHFGSNRIAANATDRSVPSGFPTASRNQSGNPVSDYQSNFLAGKDACEQGRIEDARTYFANAHTLATQFGQGDSRFIDSLYWIAKCDLSTGNYTQAKIELDWVLYKLKARFGSRSKEVLAAEADWEKAKQGLHQK